jgi:hypothetical protein
MIGAFVVWGPLGWIPILVLCILMTLAVLAGNQIVWKNTNTIEASEKAKRRSRVDRLLDRMNDADLAELRDRLMSEQDGELASLDDILSEHKRVNR